MTLTNRRIKHIALVLAVLLALSVVAGTALAATDTLAGDGTDEITGFTASADDHIEYSLSANNTDFSTDGTESVHLNVTHAGFEHASVSNSSINTSASSHTLNFSHAELSTLPGEAGGTTTINVTAWGENADGNISTPAEEFQADITFANQRSVVFIEGEDDSAVSIEEFEPGLLSLETLTFWSESDEPDSYTLDAGERDVVGNTTVVHLKNSEGNVTDAFSDVADEYSESGEPMLGMTVLVDDDPVPVFNSERNEDIVSASDTYAVYQNGDVEVNFGDSFSEDDTATVEMSNKDALEISESLSIEDVESAYADDLSVSDLRQEFSIRDIGIVRYVMSGAFLPTIVAGALPGLTLGFVVPVVIRRREA